MEVRSFLSGAEGGFRVVLPEPDESVRGYMHRLALAYGLSSVRVIMAEVSVGGPRPFSVACARRLAQLGGVDVESVAELSGFDATYLAGVSRWKFGSEHVSHFPAVNCRLLPLCVPCLHERSITPGFVHLAPMTACPVHACKLVAACPNCQSPLRVDRARLDRCHCRVNFHEVTPQEASTNEVLVVAAVFSRMSGEGHAKSKIASESGELDLSALELDDLVYMHWALGHVLPNPQEMALGTRRHLSHAENLRATNWMVSLVRSPQNLIPLIRGWQRIYAERDGRDASLPFGLFRSVLKRLIGLRALPEISNLIAAELERLSRLHEFRVSIGPTPPAQRNLF